MRSSIAPILMAPGPIRVPNVIKHTMRIDPPYFTTKEFSFLLSEIQPKLQDLFGTSDPVLIGTGSGSMGMEAAVSNFFNKDDTVVVISTGKYGQNWIRMCKEYGLATHSIKVGTPGQRPSLSRIKEIIKSVQPKPKGIFITHTETTTAVLSNLSEILELTKYICPSALTIVDAVSSLLTERLYASDCDVVISASQKAISIPPGLFFMSVSARAYDRAANSMLPKFYFDVLNERERTLKNITTFTPAAYLFPALNVALNHILEQGKPDIIQRNKSRGEYVRNSLKNDFELLSKHPCNAVSGFHCFRANRFMDKVRQRGVVIGGGHGELNNRVFRIMHFGWDLQDKEIDRTIEVIKLTI